MRIPSYSSVLGFAVLAGMVAAGVSLVWNLPDMRQARQSQRERSSRLQPEDNPAATMSHLARAQEIGARNPSAAARYYARWHEAVEELVAARPGYDQWYAAGWARNKTGDDAGAAEAWTRAADEAWALAAKSSDRRAGSLYDAACCLALAGDTEGAVEALGHAIDAGWNNRQHTLDDRDLESLRGDPRFWALLGRLPRSTRGPRGGGMLAS